MYEVLAQIRMLVMYAIVIVIRIPNQKRGFCKYVASDDLLLLDIRAGKHIRPIELNYRHWDSNFYYHLKHGPTRAMDLAEKNAVS